MVPKSHIPRAPLPQWFQIHMIQKFHNQKGCCPKVSPMASKSHYDWSWSPMVPWSQCFMVACSKLALSMLLGVFGRHWMGRVALGSQRELSVRQGVHQSVKFGFIELLMQLKTLLLQSCFTISKLNFCNQEDYKGASNKIILILRVGINIFFGITRNFQY